MNTVKSFKIGNTSYPVNDEKALKTMTSSERSQITSTGLYRGETVANGTLFLDDVGNIRMFNQTGTGEETMVVTELTPATGTSELYNIPHVCYGNGTYIFAEDNGTVCYSADGVNFTASSLSFTTVVAIAYGDVYDWNTGSTVPTFVIAGDTSIYYSTNNGQTWTRAQENGANFNRTVKALYFNPGDGNVGTGGFLALVSGQGVYRSTAGDDWQFNTSTPTSATEPVLGSTTNGIPVLLSKMDSSAYFGSNIMTMPTIDGYEYAYAVGLAATSSGTLAVLAYNVQGVSNTRLFYVYGYEDVDSMQWGTPEALGPTVIDQSGDVFINSGLIKAGTYYMVITQVYDAMAEVAYKSVANWIRPSYATAGYMVSSDLSFFNSYAGQMGCTGNSTDGSIYCFYSNSSRTATLSLDPIQRWWSYANYGATITNTQLSNKQDKLTEGDGITLTSGGNISLTTPYEVVQTMPVSPTTGKIYFVTGA